MVGTVIAIFFSCSAYKAARRTGRSVVLWVVMVWILNTACGLLFELAGIAVDVMAATEEDAENGNVEPYISYWAALAGTVIGSAWAVLLAGRPKAPANNVIDAQIIGDPPSAHPA